MAIRRHSVRVPFVEGTPVSSGSIETASRSARAKALKAGLDHVVGVGPVADGEVQGHLGVVGDGAEELLGELGVEAGDRGRGSSASKTQNGRPEMSIAHSASDSSIGTVAEP